MHATAAATVAFLLGLTAGSFIEYWAHRAMHAGVILHRAHMEHHASNRAKGVIPEGLHYALGTAWVLPWGFLVSARAGWGFLAGALCYAFFSAYGHQLQHDNPARCFWMRRMPVHAVHHRDGMTDANFGLAVSVWDHVFRTYRRRPWEPVPPRGGLLAVRWL